MRIRLHCSVALTILLFAATGTASAELMQVPIKWCVVGLDANRNGRADDNVCLSGTNMGQPCTVSTLECFCGDEDGAPAFTNPGAVGAPSTDDALWARHERTSEDVYIPRAGVTLRSALRKIVDDPRRNFPIIPDPHIGGDEYGDIRQPTQGNPDEFRDAVRDCYLEWGELYANYGVMVIDARGIPGDTGIINGIAQRFFDLGFGAYVLIEDNAYNLCGSSLYDDRDGTANDNIFAGRPCDPVDKLLGHEIGHALPTADSSCTFGVERDGLEHTNSLTNIMRQGRNGSTPDGLQNRDLSSSVSQSLTGAECPADLNSEVVDQIALIQDAAARVAGCTLSESGDPCEPGSTSPLSDVATDPRADVGAGGIDLAVFHLTESDIDDTTTAAFETYRVIPLTAVASAQETAFVALLDLDGDPATGGAPEALGLPTTFEGAEVVLRLDLTTVAIPAVPEPEALSIPLFGVATRGWRFQDGAFAEIAAGAVSGRRQPIVMRAEGVDGSELREHIGDAIAITVDNAARGPRAAGLRVQALSLRRPANAAQPVVDRIFEGAREGLDVSVKITLERPEYPVCRVSPGLGQSGSGATVLAEGLLPSEPVHVVFGSATIATGFTDADGTASVPFTIPAGSRPGLHLVTVGNDGSALTADCSVEVPGGDGVIFEYAAKIICGAQPSTTGGDFARGFYATTINVRNPHDARARISKELALAIPPGGQQPGAVLKIADETIPAHRAIAVDCKDVRKRAFPRGAPADYLDGFLVIRSDRSLDVQAVHSTATLNAEGTAEDHSAIAVEMARERRLGPASNDRRADLVVRAIDLASLVVNCPSGLGSCTSSVRVQVANIGESAAGAFVTRVTFDPEQSVDAFDVTPPNLAPGAGRVFGVTTASGGNCFDPDCTICAKVDDLNDVPESDELNNMLCVSKGG